MTTATPTVPFPFSDVTVATYRLADQTVKIGVKSPYLPAWSAAAKAMGGKWNPASLRWYFDTRDMDRVRASLIQHYGHDGQVTEIGDVTIRITGDVNTDSLTVGGRLVVERRGRDMAVSYGPGVVALDGQFARTGGSAKYPEVGGKGSILQIRDLPWAMVEQFRAAAVQLPGYVELVETSEPRQVQAPLPAPEASPLERLYAEIRKLSELEQVEIRNRLMRDL